MQRPSFPCLGRVNHSPQKPATVGALRGRKGWLGTAAAGARTHCRLLVDPTLLPLLGPLGFWAGLQAGVQASLEPQRWSGRGSGRAGLTVYNFPSSGCSFLGADLKAPIIPILHGVLNNAFFLSP